MFGETFVIVLLGAIGLVCLVGAGALLVTLILAYRTYWRDKEEIDTENTRYTEKFHD